jgi:hypothetical protein
MPPSSTFILSCVAAYSPRLLHAATQILLEKSAVLSKMYEGANAPFTAADVKIIIKINEAVLPDIAVYGGKKYG